MHFSTIAGNTCEYTFNGTGIAFVSEKSWEIMGILYLSQPKPL